MIERRYVTTDDLDIETRADAPPKIVGYAARFNAMSEDLGGFREQISQGAFAKTIRDGDVRALFNHDPNFVIGRTKANTLSLLEDDRGLKIEATPPDTQWARDLQQSIKRGDISQMSFGFSMVRDEWDHKKNLRTLLEVRLHDVSPVTFPAYPQTKVKVRMSAIGSLLEALEAGRQLSVEELRFLDSQLSDIRQLLPSAPVEDHPEGSDEQRAVEARLSRLRRHLQLADAA